MSVRLLYRIFLINFLLLAIIGVILRSMFLFEITILNYKFILQAHSHFALSGVITFSLFAVCIHHFSLSSLLVQRNIRIALLIYLIACYGMLFTFAYRGYYLFSILFSAVTLLLTNYLFYQLYKSISNDRIYSFCFRWANYFLLLSSIAPFTLGYLMKSKYAHQPLYYNTVYWYLHFQYNGFFTFIILSLFSSVLEKKFLLINTKQFRNGIIILIIATFLTYSISLLWSSTSITTNVIGLMGSLLQIIAIILLFRSINIRLKDITSKIILIILTAVLLKVLFMFTIAIPFVDYNAVINRHVVIGFLHLVLIGIIWLSVWKFVKDTIIKSLFINVGIFLFLSSFMLTEIFLFSSVLKLNISYYNHLLFVLAAISTLGILLMNTAKFIKL